MTNPILKQRLLERRARLANDLAEREGIAIEREIDPMDDLQNRVPRELAIDRLTRRAPDLARVEAALHIMEDGRYGACLECGHKISTKRLIAAPWAVLCVNCQYKEDRNRAVHAA